MKRERGSKQEQGILEIGNTYHFWGDSGGFVIPATLTFDHDRYEVAFFG